MNTQIFWEKTKQNEAKILRIYGTSPEAEVPAQIEGCAVTELADYCFASDPHLPKHFLMTDTADTIKSNTCAFTELAELSGDYPQSVWLPDTLTKIGNYAFYNCKNLRQITFGQALTSIGSDAFMNCHQLHHLFIRSSIYEKTGLQRILSQIPWDVSAVFFGYHSSPGQKEAVVFYPEYFELYDEIAPAHIFGRSIAGEGFRARQSFQDGIIDFHQYDKIFQKACAEESVLTSCLIAFYRLYFPIHLSPQYKTPYENYILANAQALCRHFIKNRQLESLYFLFQQKLVSQNTVPDILAMAVQAGWSEAGASILRWKQAFYPDKKRTRYEFEDF